VMRESGIAPGSPTGARIESLRRWSQRFFSLRLSTRCGGLGSSTGCSGIALAEGRLLALPVVARILARHGLVGRREPNAQAVAVGRFERSRINELWQMDFTAPAVLPDGRAVWVCAALDDRSRYCLSVRAGLDCSARGALACFREAAERGGLPEEVLTDHGSAFGVAKEFVSAFRAYLRALGVKHTQSRYRHPQTQGTLERFNGTLQAECVDGRCCGSIQEWNLCLEEYRNIYNGVRPHEALGDETPASLYQPSGRAFAEPDRAAGERGEIVRRVGPDGRLMLLQHRVKVGKGLAGWYVSARHQKGGYWLVEFRGHPICQVHLAKRTTYRPKP
jgi:transposase InsO family protein